MSVGGFSGYYFYYQKWFFSRVSCPHISTNRENTKDYLYDILRKSKNFRGSFLEVSIRTIKKNRTINSV